MLLGAGLAVTALGLANVGPEGEHRSESTTVPSSSSPSTTVDRVAIRDDFIDRWETWRRATLRFRETTERTSGDQRSASAVTIVQRFPDRAVLGGGTVSARIGSRLIGCAPTTRGPIACYDSGGFEPEAELSAELDEFVKLTSGSAPTYELTTIDDQCFRFTLAVSDPRPRWGEQYDVCFDATTSAVSREVTVAGALTIRVSRQVESTSVDAAELNPPAPIAPSGAGPSTSTPSIAPVPSTNATGVPQEGGLNSAGEQPM